MNRLRLVRTMGGSYVYRCGRFAAYSSQRLRPRTVALPPPPTAVIVHFSDRKGFAPFRSFLTLRERPPQSRQEVGMPHGLALAAQLVATFSLLVVPALALFLLSLALRRTTSRDSCASARQGQSGREELGRK
jgi:hypothetical protein